MFGRIAVWLAVSALKRADLSVRERTLLTTILLDRLAALPLRDIITVDAEGLLLVNGNVVDMDIARKLRESARAALDNYAETYVEDQVLHEALKLGIHKAVKDEDLFFAKAAIWWGQRRHAFLTVLAQSAERELAP